MDISYLIKDDCFTYSKRKKDNKHKARKGLHNETAYINWRAFSNEVCVTIEKVCFEPNSARDFCKKICQNKLIERLKKS